MAVRFVDTDVDAAVPGNRRKTGKRAISCTAFRPGQSGNPSGRPKKTQDEYDLENACRVKTPEALKIILKLMESADKDKVSLEAAIFVIERGYGKATQVIEAPKSELEEAATALLLEMREVLASKRQRLT